MDLFDEQPIPLHEFQPRTPAVKQAYDELKKAQVAAGGKVAIDGKKWTWPEVEKRLTELNLKLQGETGVKREGNVVKIPEEQVLIKVAKEFLIKLPAPALERMRSITLINRRLKRSEPLVPCIDLEWLIPSLGRAVVLSLQDNGNVDFFCTYRKFHNHEESIKMLRQLGLFGRVDIVKEEKPVEKEVAIEVV